MGTDFTKLFGNAVDTVFSIFESLIKPGYYVLSPTNDGWDSGSDEPQEFSMEVIVGGFSQRDKQNTSFYAQIHPTDTIVMIKGSDIVANGIKVSNSDKFKIEYTSGTITLDIINHDVDPAEALYILLLRVVNV